MQELFFTSFLSIGGALLKVFLIAALAGFMTFRKLISEEFVDGLASLVVKVFLPLQIFSTIVINFDPEAQSYWWAAPLVGIAMALGGLVLAAMLFAGNSKGKRFLFPLAGMQNSVYLTLPIAEFAFPDQFAEFSFICFLVLMGLNPVMWSVGKLIITGNKGNGSMMSRIITPPFVASIIAIVIVLAGFEQYVPVLLVDSAEMLGEATVPVATFILGATLAMSIKTIPPFWDTFRILIIKFFIIPAATILIMLWLKTGEQFPLFAQVMVIQAAAAPATAHILMVRTYGGDIRHVGGIIFVSYLVCLPAIPFWLSLWNYLSIG